MFESFARPVVSKVPEAGEGAPLDDTEIDRIIAKAVADGRLPEGAADSVKERLSQFTTEQLEQFIERLGQGGFAGRAAQGGQSGQNLTDEQRQQLRQRGDRGGFFGNQDGQSSGGRPLGNLQLREGLSVTVRIIIQQRTNILLVPNQAITLDGEQSYVNVSQGDIIEPRLVIVGLSDWQNTEIIDGLGGDEVVAIPVSVSPESSQQRNRFGIPGGGGFGR